TWVCARSTGPPIPTARGLPGPPPDTLERILEPFASTDVRTPVHRGAAAGELCWVLRGAACLNSVVAHDPTQLPADLPQPPDGGGADHLPGAALPPIALPSTDGEMVRLDAVPVGFARLVVYAYPLTGRPGIDPPTGWDGIPGARGCTPESCGFRDHAAELAAA